MSAESNPQEEDAGELPPIVAAATAGNHVAAASAAAGSNDIAAVVAAAPKTAPPGAKSFQKCQTDPAYSELEAVAVNVLLAVSASDVLAMKPGSHLAKPVWDELLNTLFSGNISNGRRDGNGVLSGFKVWKGERAATTKLKPLVKEIIDHFSSIPVEENDSALVLLAKQLNHVRKAAQRKKDEEKNLKLAQRLQNESAETEVGFRTPGYGVDAPSLPRPAEASDLAALASLAQPTASVTQSNGELMFYWNRNYIVMSFIIICLTLIFSFIILQLLPHRHPLQPLLPWQEVLILPVAGPSNPLLQCLL